MEQKSAATANPARRSQSHNKARPNGIKAKIKPDNVKTARMQRPDNDTLAGVNKGCLQKIKTADLVTLSQLTFTHTPTRLLVTSFNSDKVVSLWPIHSLENSDIFSSLGGTTVVVFELQLKLCELISPWIEHVVCQMPNESSWSLVSILVPG